MRLFFMILYFCVQTLVQTEICGAEYRETDNGTISNAAVELKIQDNYVVIDNGICEVTLSKPEGIVTGIKYSGIDNLLEELNSEDNRGYWDIVWSFPNSTTKKGNFDRIKATDFEVITQSPEQVEVSFTRQWNNSFKSIPLKIDIRFVMLRGSSGFYTYGSYEHLEEYPAFKLENTRMAFKLRKDKFGYMAISDDRQRKMPLPEDRLAGRGQPLEYPEAVLLYDPVEPEFKGEVDDKYQYSCDNEDIRVHGWISADPSVGFWQITPSSEFRCGGPTKQSLTSHVGPTSLSIFHSTHYVGADIMMKFEENEAWKKVYGPVFIYLNKLDQNDQSQLWEDAKQQTWKQDQNWPYSFPALEDFLSADKRGTVTGKLFVQENGELISANGAHIGLGNPGDAGSWQKECKNYQFWTTTDKNGSFTIKNIRPGDYNIYAFVPGFIGDYRNDDVITITSGSDNNLGKLIYKPPRDGPTLWEIGIADRTAKEFYIPDPNPKYINPLFVNHTDRYRQYGLWERYAEIYNNGDMVFRVGIDDYKKDWFFAQVTRSIGDHIFEGTTWQIKFNLTNVNKQGTYKLRLALATADHSELLIRINDLSSNPIFSSGSIGKDNTIARHGIHGIYLLYNIDIKGDEIFEGENTIYLSQVGHISTFQGVMYDYIRLEGPPM